MKLVENIDIENGLVGGIILGTATSVFMYLTGKVTGLSGIAEGIVSVKGEDWNFTYVAGLCSAGALLALYRPDSFGDASLLSSTALLAAGAITGFGTRLGGGCTSGHGLCGLPKTFSSLTHRGADIYDHRRNHSLPIKSSGRKSLIVRVAN